MDTTKQRLENKVSVVIGGSTGFGKATVELFSEHGARVIVVGRRKDLAEQVAQEFGGKGFACDVVEDGQVKNLVDSVLETEGAIDVVVNYAGYQESRRIRELTPEHVRPMVEVQLIGALQVIQHFGNAMASNGGGSIISTSSLTAHLSLIHI